MKISVDLLSVILSFLYVFFIIFLAYISYRKLGWKGESVRKLIHILVSCWIFVPVYAMTDSLCMLIGPIAFTFINLWFVLSGSSSHLGMEDRKRNNGLIYYPISLLVLVFLYSCNRLSGTAIIAGILMMGWGDGSAALVGSKWGSHSYYVYKDCNKSLEGSAAMLAVCFLILILFTDIPLFWALLASLAVVSIENMTPLGFDNLTVPLAGALLVEVLCAL